MRSRSASLKFPTALSENLFSQDIENNAAIGVGFVDGDIEILFKKN